MDWESTNEYKGFSITLSHVCKKTFIVVLNKSQYIIVPYLEVAVPFYF